MSDQQKRKAALDKARKYKHQRNKERGESKAEEAGETKEEK